MTYALVGAGGYCTRMRGYFREMFPLAGHLALAVLAAAGIAGFVRFSEPGVPFSAQAIFSPAWNIFAMLLILRLMDELKDRDIDRQLFPQRPLPAGRVAESDIRGTLYVAVVLYLASNTYSLPVLLFAVLVACYAWLMYVRFFVPTLLKRNLAVTLATHTPIFPLLLLQGFVAAADRLGLPLSDLDWSSIALYVAMVWFSILSWELSRKIRAPKDETAYVTYSRILGTRGAVAAIATLQAVVVVLGMRLYVEFDLPTAYPVFLCAGWLVCVYAYVRFLRRPDSSTSQLKPYATTFIFAMLVAQLYAYGLPA